MTTERMRMLRTETGWLPGRTSQYYWRAGDTVDVPAAWADTWERRGIARKTPARPARSRAAASTTPTTQQEE